MIRAQRISPHFSRLALTTVLLAAVWAGGVRTAVGQTLLEYSAEARFQLDFHVPDAALNAMLPPGFTLNVATQGAAKDANIRVIFVDRMTINGADGKPVGKGSSRLVYLAAPVKDPSGANAQLVVGGLTDDPADAPGPFGIYLLATTHTMQRSTNSTGSGPVLDAQDWVFQAAGGERLELHIKYEHGVGNKGAPADVKFYSAKNPSVAAFPSGAGARHPAQRDHHSAGPCEGVFIQRLWWQLREAVRWDGARPQLGQHRLDQPFRYAAIIWGIRRSLK